MTTTADPSPASNPAPNKPGPEVVPAPPGPAPATPPAKPVAAKPAAPPPPPPPQTKTPDGEELLARFGAALEHIEDCAPDIPMFQLKQPAELLEVARFLQKERAFEHLACITGVDYKDRIEVIYNFWSYSKNIPIGVKVPLPRADPHLPSLTSLWATADWHERENWDLMGIKFDGHPDLRRILLPEGWKGHPLRKDYEWKKEQYVALDPVTGEDVVYQESREGAW